MKLCFIIGNQRTGTNLLRDLLVANDDMSIAGEVITPSDHPACWYNLLMRRGIGCLGPQDWDGMNELVNEWMAAMQQSMIHTWENGSTKSLSSWVGGDIKYSQLRAISPLYWELSEIPFMLMYIMSKYGFVIHTRRRNTLKMVLSAMIAEQSGVWHQSSTKKFVSKFPIDIQSCIMRMRSARKEEETFLRLSAGVQTIECFYEDLAHCLAAPAGAGLSGPLLNIKALLGINGVFASSSSFCKVVSQPYGEVISNFQPLMKAVSRTEFAHMAEEIRAEEAPKESTGAKQARAPSAKKPDGVRANVKRSAAPVT